MCHFVYRPRESAELVPHELVCSTNADRLMERVGLSLPAGAQVVSVAPCLGALNSAVSSPELRRYVELARA